MQVFQLTESITM